MQHIATGLGGGVAWAEDGAGDFAAMVTVPLHVVSIWLLFKSNAQVVFSLSPALSSINSFVNNIIIAKMLA